MHGEVDVELACENEKHENKGEYRSWPDENKNTENNEE